MSITKLTQKQKKALSVIQDYYKKHGFSPTLEQVGNKMNIQSLSAVHKHVTALREKGYLKNEPKPTRSINIFNENTETREIPLLGKISAGPGIVPFENPEPIKVPSSLCCGQGMHFALKIEGDSMIEEGIRDGSMAVIRSQNVAQNGETVVAIINDGVEELATLKKFYNLGDKIRLVAANPNLKDWPREFEIGDVEIRGKFCGLIRKEE